MTRRRLVLLLAWALLVAGGVWVQGRLHPAGGPVVRAAKVLPANHLIRDADLAVDASTRVRRGLPAVRALLGRYLVGAKGQGEAITRDDVTDLPTLPGGGAGQATVVYQLPEAHRALGELLDVGARVRLCAPPSPTSAPPCHADPVEVLAVHPAGPGATDAWLLLGLPSAGAAALHPYLTAEGRYPTVA